MTTCDYCGHENSEIEHRCNRCGRRPDGAGVVSSRTSPARALAPDVPAESGPGHAIPNRPLQRPLFSTHVVRFEDVDPSVRPRRRRAGTSRKPGSRKKVSASQQSFEFVDLDEITAQSAAVALQASPELPVAEPARSCEDEVAPIALRMTACAADCGVVLAAAAVFLGVFRLWTGGLVWSGAAVGVFACAAVVITAFYRLLWSLAGADSPGMQWCGLRLLRLEGHPPSAGQRLARVLAGCLSVGALGLGLLWALTDPERLTWHDHISKTFPTPRFRA